MQNQRVPLSKIVSNGICLVAALGFLGILAAQTAGATDISRGEPDSALPSWARTLVPLAMLR